jgi:hypothetical protein
VPGGAAELAVGRGAQPDVGLHPDDVGDGSVLNGTQLRRVDLSDREARPGGVQVRRPQEAPDVVGAKRRAIGHGHHSAGISRDTQPDPTQVDAAVTDHGRGCSG